MLCAKVNGLTTNRVEIPNVLSKKPQEMSMNSGGNSLFSICLMAECKSHRSLSLLFLSVAALGIYKAFSICNNQKKQNGCGFAKLKQLLYNK